MSEAAIQRIQQALKEPDVRVILVSDFGPYDHQQFFVNELAPDWDWLDPTDDRDCLCRYLDTPSSPYLIYFPREEIRLLEKWVILALTRPPDDQRKFILIFHTRNSLGLRVLDPRVVEISWRDLDV